MEVALEKEKGEKRKTVLNTLNRLSAKGVHFIFFTFSLLDKRLTSRNEGMMN